MFDYSIVTLHMPDDNTTSQVQSLYDLCYKNDGDSLCFYIENEPFEIISDIPLLYLCYDNNLLIGVLSLCIDFYDENNSSETTIYGFVHPLYRKQHVFTNLFNTAVKILAEYNITKFEFHIPDNINKRYYNSIHNNRHIEIYNSFFQKYNFFESHREYLLEKTLSGSIDIPIYRIRDDISDFEPEIEFDHENNEFNLWMGEKYIGGCFVYFSENNFCTIYDFLINENYRGKGYGKVGLLLILNALYEISCPKVILHVSGLNKIAHNLYTSCGFKVNSSFTVFKNYHD